MDYYRILCGEDGSVKSVSRFDHEPVAVALGFITSDEALGQADPRGLRATIVAGQVEGVAVDPAWQPPGEPLDIPAEIEALKAVVANNALASENDQRWLKVKNAAKDLGIPWIREHPVATSEEAVAAVATELRADADLLQDEAVQGSAEHLVRWLLATYAATAKARGYIPEASFEALRALVVGATDKQLKQMLRVI